MLQISFVLGILFQSLSGLCRIMDSPPQHFWATWANILQAMVCVLGAMALMKCFVASLKHCCFERCFPCGRQVIAAYCWCATNYPSARESRIGHRQCLCKLVVLVEQMPKIVLQTCAPRICANHHTSEVHILVAVHGSCMLHAWPTCI